MTTGYLNGFRQAFSSMSPPVKILLVCLFVLLFLFISTFFAALIAIPVFGYNVAEMLEMISRPDYDNLHLIKYFQIIQSIFVFVIPSMLAAWLFSEDTYEYLKAKSKTSVVSIILVLFSVILAIPFLNALTALNAKLDLPAWLDTVEQEIIALEESATRLTELLLESKNYNDLAVNLLMIAVLPALGEEFLFRGVFQRLFAEWTRNHHMGVLLGAFIFSFFHFQFFGFLPRFLLGMYFGYLYVWSGTIWMPVAGHFINNALAVIYYHFSAKEMGETVLDNIGTKTENAYVLIVSLILTSLLLYTTFWYEKKRRLSQAPI